MVYEERRKKKRINTYEQDSYISTQQDIKDSHTYSTNISFDKTLNLNNNLKLDNTFNILPVELNIHQRTYKPVIVYKENKIIKSTILNKLVKDIHSKDPLTLYSVYNEIKKTSLTEDLYLIIFNRCKEVLYRDIRNTTPTGIEYHVMDDVNRKNKISSNINIFSKILCHMTSVIPKNCVSYVISDKDIYSLIKLLKSEDEVERSNIAGSIINLYMYYKTKIQNLVENELCLYYKGLRTHIGIEEIVEIVQCILEESELYKPMKRSYEENLENNPRMDELSPDISRKEAYRRILLRSVKESPLFIVPLPCKDPNRINQSIFFYEYVLSFLKTRHLEYYKIIPQIIFRYCKNDIQTSKLVLKYIYSIFVEVEYSNKPVLLQVYFSIYILWHKFIKNEYLLEQVCDLINITLNSYHTILIERLFKFLENKCMKKLVSENISFILPRIFNKLYTLSKKYWCVKGLIIIYKYIEYLVSTNHACFEDCLKKYNKDKWHIRYDTSFVDQGISNVNNIKKKSFK